MSENYIVINGKRAELTEEQMKQLGIVTEKKSPFARQELNEKYYMINSYGDIGYTYEMNDSDDEDRYKISNYCTDKAIMEQRALHEILSRLLWRYSMEHKGDEIDKRYYSIYKDRNKFKVQSLYDQSFFEPRFYSGEIAENAIKEIIEPFMKEHPDFVW